jgi:hypothetical protein
MCHHGAPTPVLMRPQSVRRLWTESFIVMPLTKSLRIVELATPTDLKAKSRKSATWAQGVGQLWCTQVASGPVQFDGQRAQAVAMSRQCAGLHGPFFWHAATRGHGPLCRAGGGHRHLQCAREEHKCPPAQLCLPHTFLWSSRAAC